AVEQNIRHRMTSMAAWYPKLGGHLRKAERGENIFKAGFRKAFLEAGATHDDFREAFKAAGMAAADIEREIKKLPPEVKKPGDGACLRQEWKNGRMEEWTEHVGWIDGGAVRPSPVPRIGAPRVQRRAA
ncbi:hypothetical protein HQ560_13195, partial [bacterium]|nr:hypothetical protein [bacterium]